MQTAIDRRAFAVRCLACGAVRVVRRTASVLLDSPACHACGYVGWREGGADEAGPRAARMPRVAARAAH